MYRFPGVCQLMVVRYLSPVLLCSACLLLCACASTDHGESEDVNFLGGGLSVEELSESEYLIVAKTNFSASENYPGAKRIWERAAYRACGNEHYVEADIRERSYRHTLSLLGVRPYLITERSGRALCVADAQGTDNPGEGDSPETPADLF